jgi:hypothetical protein
MTRILRDFGCFVNGVLHKYDTSLAHSLSLQALNQVRNLVTPLSGSVTCSGRRSNRDIGHIYHPY